MSHEARNSGTGPEWWLITLPLKVAYGTAMPILRSENREKRTVALRAKFACGVVFLRAWRGHFRRCAMHDCRRHRVADWRVDLQAINWRCMFGNWRFKCFNHGYLLFLQLFADRLKIAKIAGLLCGIAESDNGLAAEMCAYFNDLAGWCVVGIAVDRECCHTNHASG